MGGTKRCGQCGQVKQASEFGANRAKEDGLQSQCRNCKKLMQARWYIRHKNEHVENVNRRRKERSREVQRQIMHYLETHHCVDRGENDILILEFDHVSGEKRAAISQMVCDGLAWGTVLSEIQKCEVRCVRCHRHRSALQFGYGRLNLLTQNDFAI